MHEGKKTNILGKLTAIFNKTMSSRSGPLVIPHNDEFRSIVNSLLKEDGWRGKFSEKFIIGNVDEVLMKMCGDGNILKAADYLDQMTHKLDSFSTEQIVYIPLHGIAKPDKEIIIGNITIKCVNATEADGLIEKVRSDQPSVESINKHIRDHVCAVFRFVAEPEHALERAEEETRRAIDLLRYSIPAIYPYSISKRVAIGLQGEVCHAWRYMPIDSHGAQSFASRGQSIGPLYEFDFSPENIQKMEQLGVFKLSKILQSEELSEFEKKLVSSIHWFANSQTRTENADKLLNLVTCLEIFLSPGVGPIVQNVSEGVAMLISDSAVERKKIIDRIRTLYSIRSNLSHHGKGEVHDLDLLDLIRIDYTVLNILIDRSDEFNDRGKPKKEKSDKDTLQKWVVYVSY